MPKLIESGQGLVWDPTSRDFKPGDIVPLPLSADTVYSSNVLAALGNTRDVKLGKTYQFTGVLYLADPNSEGIQIRFNGGTATVSALYAALSGFDEGFLKVGYAHALTDIVSFLGLFGGYGKIEIEGTFTASSDGTFGITAAQLAHAVGSLTILKGSPYFMIREVT